MAWVKAEYADELAVVTTWLVALLPWSVSYTTDAPFESPVYFLRFPLFELQARFPADITANGQQLDVAAVLSEQYGGVALFGDVYLGSPVAAVLGGPGAVLAYGLWTVAALLVAVAVVLSVGMYLREDAVSEWLPVNYVRLTGAVFAVAAVPLAAATVLFASSETAYGTPIPVGLVLMVAVAYLLLTADLASDAETA